MTRSQAEELLCIGWLAIGLWSPVTWIAIGGFILAGLAFVGALVRAYQDNRP